MPDRCPDLDTPEAKMWADAGAARVVRYLREQRARQEQQSLTGSTLGRDASPRSMRFT